MSQDFGAGRSKSIDQFLRDHLTERHFKFWMDFTSQFPLPFHRPSSSSGKYHRDAAGSVHNLEQHTLELLIFVEKLACIFGSSREEQLYDLMLLACALHDIHKYGLGNHKKHTTSDHGYLTAKAVFRDGIKLGLSEIEAETLGNLILYHDGLWNSTNPTRKPVEMTKYELLIHIADMASSRRIIKINT